MSYETEAAKVGAEPVRIVEMDLDFCANTYGVAPCTAALGVTGTAKCYNGFQGCQDQANFVKSSKTLRFWPAQRPLPKVADLGFEVYPFLRRADIAATVLDPDHGLGPRGTVEIAFTDAVDDDALIDPYKAERAHDTAQGSFFGKLKARHGQALLGREIRVRDGFVKAPWDWGVFRDHVYLIDDYSGPDDRGVFTIRAIDPISRAKTKLYPAPAQAPLTADITATDTSLNLLDVRGTHTATSGTLNIGDEILDYASRTVEADGTLTLGGLTRGLWGTAADEHKAGANVQACGVFNEQYIVDILTALYQAADLDSFIDTVGWQAEQDAWRRTIRFTHVIVKPTPIYKLIKQVAEQAGMFQWWDELSQKVKLAAIAPALLNTLPPVLTEGDTILAGTLRVDEGQRGQLTRVIVNYLPYDRINLDKATDYSARYARINTETESANAYNRVIELEVFAPWLRTETDAEALAVRKLARRGLGDNRIRFEIDKKDKQICEAGDVVALLHPHIQDDTGARKQVNVRVLKARPIDNTRIEIEATTSTYQTGTDPDERVWIWQDDDVSGLAYASATEEQRLRAFWADDNGQVAPGVSGYRWY